MFNRVFFKFSDWRYFYVQRFILSTSEIVRRIFFYKEMINKMTLSCIYRLHNDANNRNKSTPREATNTLD